MAPDHLSKVNLLTNQANAVSFGVGTKLPNQCKIRCMQSQLNIAARVLDIGAPMKYNSNNKYDLPTSAQTASADITMPF